MGLITVNPIQTGDDATPELWNSRYATIVNLLNGNLDATNLADNAVTTPKLTNSSVTTAKLASGAVTNSVLDTTAGGPGGVWKDYTPVWTGLTVGNGTVTARYTQIGKTVHMYVCLVAGSTTSVSGNVTMSLPLTSRNTGSLRMPQGIIEYENNAISNNIGAFVVGYGDPGSAGLMVFNSAGTYLGWAQLNASVPFGIGIDDNFQGNLTYEVA